jgi:hypothetical protein
MYIERFEYFCPDCNQKGIVTDVLLNPELVIIRGRCPTCNLQSAYKVVDMAMLQAEYEVISEPVSKEDQSKTKNGVTWNMVRFKAKGM